MRWVFSSVLGGGGAPGGQTRREPGHPPLGVSDARWPTRLSQRPSASLRAYLSDLASHRAHGSCSFVCKPALFTEVLS
ncbi:hypothetical protein LX36DRAFT_464086 [Colletotrichum falcatum]|nr:hypothetical protein LX36DRAFT_464086 [Colletotrichum falcatum]